jgi:5'-AMP-activated protein kinase regulatory beta subunit
MKKSGTRQIPKRKRVQFVFETTDALEVAVSGDFNGWDPGKHMMTNNGHGLWKKTMMLPPGQYEYKFVVDGEWQIDPDNQCLNSNCFGTCNNILKIPHEDFR